MKHREFASLPVEIETVYRLFSPRRLKKTDLRSLTWEEVEEWMRESVGYVGGDDEFRELLPRFLELAWGEAMLGEGVDMSPLWSLGLGRVCLSWPVHEREAIEGCLVLLWRLALEKQDPQTMNEVLEVAKVMGFVWPPFLEMWFHSMVQTSILARAISLSRWDDLPLDTRRWLCRKAVFERIQADFYVAQDVETRATISEFEETLAFYVPVEEL